jgi:hypothetical protein
MIWREYLVSSSLFIAASPPKVRIGYNNALGQVI